jgi:uncharacterized membrane protein YqjE
MDNLIKTLKNMFRTPSALELAQIELEEAKRELLNAQSATEYAARMAAYHGDRIKRLTIYVNGQPGQDIKQKVESPACQ